jgi:sarcosine oxidase subunit beta
MPEIVIVGAGVIGASTAFHLAERGAGPVTVLDARRAGEGMSSRSSALVRMHYTFEPEVRLAVRSLEYFRDWPDRVGRPSPFTRCGFVRIVGPGESGPLRENVGMQRACGADVRLIGPDELGDLEPGWSVGDVEVAAYEPDGGYGDGAVVAGDFLSRAREMGAGYRPNTPVRALAVTGDRVRGVVTDAGEVAADVVVVAVGPWTAPLVAGAGVELPIETEYHEVAVLRQAPGGPAVRTACIDSGTSTYFRPEGAGGVLVGDFAGPRGASPDDFPQTAGTDSLAELIGRAAKRVPALEGAGLAGGTTGVYDMTPDARPLLGGWPGLDGLVIAAGFSGMGFKISPAVGHALAAAILDGADLSPFRPSRFAEGKPIVPPHPYADD